jgi:chaperonin GroEL
MVDGMEFYNGYKSPYFVNTLKGTCEFGSCKVAIIDREISNIDQITHVLKASLVGENLPLLIICHDMTEPALPFVLHQIREKGYKFCVVKAPYTGGSRAEWIEDMCILTGATPIGGPGGKDFKDVIPQVLGNASGVVVSDSRTLIRVQQKPKAVEDRIQLIKNELASCSAPHRIEICV